MVWLVVGGWYRVNRGDTLVGISSTFTCWVGRVVVLGKRCLSFVGWPQVEVLDKGRELVPYIIKIIIISR
jgi:hypothetical protein